jgi:hypothetical protein
MRCDALNCMALQCTTLHYTGSGVLVAAGSTVLGNIPIGDGVIVSAVRRHTASWLPNDTVHVKSILLVSWPRSWSSPGLDIPTGTASITSSI